MHLEQKIFSHKQSEEHLMQHISLQFLHKFEHSLQEVFEQFIHFMEQLRQGFLLQKKHFCVTMY